MSLFSTILEKIFPHDSAQAQASTPDAVAAATTSTAPVNAEASLEAWAAQKPEKLNWRTSIVDLLKVLDLDSSLPTRKALASELHYSGDTNDSAAMNVWLHAEVMKKIQANGGQKPRDLRASA